MKKESSPQIFLIWNILKECNFSCNYCVVKAPEGKGKEVDIPRVVQRLDKLNKTLLIHSTGGEPFLVPNFVKLIQEITKRNQVRIDTNLTISKACKEFVNNINPDKVVEICFSTHILERQKIVNGLNKLCSTVNMFQDRGFKMIGNYVAYPSLMGRIEKDIDFFDSQGIKVLPTFFWGKFKGKPYPLSKDHVSYSRDEFELLIKLNPNIKAHLLNTKNSLCHAGSAAFIVSHNYEVTACNAIPKNLGNFFDDWHVFEKVIRCPSSSCLCPHNRAPAVTLFPDNFPTIGMLNGIISEKGAYSRFNSYRLINGIAPRIVASSIIRRLIR